MSLAGSVSVEIFLLINFFIFEERGLELKKFMMSLKELEI